MTPVVLAVAGAAALVGAVVVLRTFGPGYRLGRLLAVTPRIAVEAAVADAHAAVGRYVRIEGRIDSETDFEDEHHRPLVFRRRRLEIRRRGRWEAIDAAREAVPFEIREGLAAIAVDTDALDEGLVVIPREAVGSAADAPDRAPADVPPTAPLRIRVEQVSSVEHAIVVGVPTLAADGGVAMTAGSSRPLILTTLEADEAMRLLAGGRRTRPVLATVLLVGGFVLVIVAFGWALVRGAA
ncbi:MAG: hypothetical protein ACHQ3P_03530 [Candidatus Limnocylindrales bacterium]